MPIRFWILTTAQKKWTYSATSSNLTIGSCWFLVFLSTFLQHFAHFHFTVFFLYNFYWAVEGFFQSGLKQMHLFVDSTPFFMPPKYPYQYSKRFIFCPHRVYEGNRPSTEQATQYLPVWLKSSRYLIFLWRSPLQKQTVIDFISPLTQKFEKGAAAGILFSFCEGILENFQPHFLSSSLH